MKRNSFAPINTAVKILPLNTTYRTWVKLMVAIQRARTVDVAILSARTGLPASRIGTLLATFESFGWIRNGRVVTGWLNTLFANASSHGKVRAIGTRRVARAA